MNKGPDRSQRKALGKGLSALLPPRPKASEAAPEQTTAPAPVKSPPLPTQFDDFQSLALDRIERDPRQPREDFDAAKLEELAQSIRSLGVIQPVTVRKVNEGRYRLIAGERRWLAARLAGLSEIPALVRSVQGTELLELALIENIQREDLNPIEIATAFERLATEHHLSHEQIAQRTGKERSTVTNFLRLLRLPESIRQDLIRGEISMGHARALLNVNDSKEQASLCTRIKGQQLSVRELEGLVRQLTEGGKKGSPAKEELPLDPNIRAALDEIRAALGTRVRLIPKNERAGRLEVEYYSPEDLERIYSVITRQ